MTAFAPLGATTLGQASTSANYIIGAGSGTFTLSMRGAALLIGDIFPHGVFEVDGRAVTLSAQRPYSVNNGAFTYTGQDLELDYGFGIVTDTQTFTYTGQNVVLDVGFGIGANTGTFTLTGQNIDFTKQMNVSAETGTFTYTGQDALKGVGEAFERGQFTYTGQDVTMFAGRFLRPETSQYSYTFQDFKTRGWFSPTVPPAIWTEVA